MSWYLGMMLTSLRYAGEAIKTLLVPWVELIMVLLLPGYRGCPPYSLNFNGVHYIGCMAWHLLIAVSELR